MKPGFKTLIAAGLMAAAVAMPTMSLADKLPLAEISNFLNALKTAQGTFTQINDDGTISTGKILIKRPGRMRFEYNAPDTALVVANKGAVKILDTKSNQPPETYPLRRTPLSIILARNVNLDQARMVVGHDYDGTATVVTAQDPENPDYGNIQLKFTGNPVELRQWVIRDSSGSETTVILQELEKGVALPNVMFNIN